MCAIKRVFGIPPFPHTTGYLHRETPSFHPMANPLSCVKVSFRKTARRLLPSSNDRPNHAGAMYWPVGMTRWTSSPTTAFTSRRGRCQRPTARGSWHGPSARRKRQMAGIRRRRGQRCSRAQRQLH